MANKCNCGPYQGCEICGKYQTSVSTWHEEEEKRRAREKERQKARKEAKNEH